MVGASGLSSPPSPVPDGLAKVFEGIAEKLLQFSADDEKEARQLVPDVVLGTKNQGGGPSVFQKYRQILEERQLLELSQSRMTTHIVEAWPPWTQAQVYKSVADETGRDVEYIRKLFEQHDRDLVRSVSAPFAQRNSEEASLTSCRGSPRRGIRQK